MMSIKDMVWCYDKKSYHHSYQYLLCHGLHVLFANIFLGFCQWTCWHCAIHKLSQERWGFMMASSQGMLKEWKRVGLSCDLCSVVKSFSLFLHDCSILKVWDTLDCGWPLRDGLMWLTLTMTKCLTPSHHTHIHPIQPPNPHPFIPLHLQTQIPYLLPIPQHSPPLSLHIASHTPNIISTSSNPEP